MQTLTLTTAVAREENLITLIIHVHLSFIWSYKEL